MWVAQYQTLQKIQEKLHVMIPVPKRECGEEDYGMLTLRHPHCWVELTAFKCVILVLRKNVELEICM